MGRASGLHLMVGDLNNMYIKGAGGPLSLASSQMCLCVFVMKNMKGYQMLFTGLKNVVPGLIYRDLKFEFYVRLH